MCLRGKKIVYKQPWRCKREKHRGSAPTNQMLIPAKQQGTGVRKGKTCERYWSVFVWFLSLDTVFLKYCSLPLSVVRKEIGSTIFHWPIVWEDICPSEWISSVKVSTLKSEEKGTLNALQCQANLNMTSPGWIVITYAYVIFHMQYEILLIVYG